MAGPESPPRPARRYFHVPGSPTLRWAGLRGSIVSVHLSADSDPVVTLRGDKGGEVRFAVSEITALRVGREYGRTTHHHCHLWRRGPMAMNIGAQPDVVLHLAQAMARLGHIRRVQLGLPLWQALVHVVLFGGFGIVLSLALIDIARRAGGDWSVWDMLAAGSALLVGLGALAWAVWSWLRFYRPRPVRDLDELRAELA